MVLGQTTPLSQCQPNTLRDRTAMFCQYTESGQMQLKEWIEELWHLYVYRHKYWHMHIEGKKFIDGFDCKHTAMYGAKKEIIIKN